MPKIGTKIEKIKEQHVELVIWYTRESGFFYKNLPSDFINITGFCNGGYKSEDALLGSFRSALNVYHERMKQTKKIIKYSLFGSLEMLMNKETEYRYSGYKKEVSKKFENISSSGYVFGFDYKILIETSGTDRKRYYHLKEDGSVGYEVQNIGNINAVDWTPEREQFFKNMEGSMQRLVNRASSFFDNPDAVQLMGTGGFKAIE